MTTPGLDNIQQTSDVPDYGVPTNAPKSKYLPSMAGSTPLGPQQTNELLANMQRLIEQRTGAWNTMMGGIQDALAFTAPVANGQQALALQYRNEQKRKEAEELMGMQSSMASLISGQNMYQNQLKMMNKMMGLDEEGQPAGAGRADVVGGGTSGVPQNVGMGGGLNIPASARANIAMSANPVAAMQEYLKKTSEEDIKAARNPAWGAMTEVMGADGQLTSVPLSDAVELARMNPNNPRNRAVLRIASEMPPPSPQAREGTGVNQFNVGNVRPAGQSTGFQQPKSYEEGMQIMDSNLQSYGKKGINTLRGVISRWSPPNENNTEALIKAASQRLGLNPDQPIDLTNPVQRQLIGSALMLQEKGPKQLFAQAPTATMTDASTPPRALPGETPATYKERVKQWEGEQTTRREGLGSQVKETNEFLKGLKSGAEAAKTKKGMVQHIERSAVDTPDDFYVAGQTSGGKGVMGAIVNARKFMGGDEKAKDAEQSLEPYFMSKEAVDRRRKIDAYAGQLAMGSSKELLGDSSVRLGAQIEKMFLDYKGLGTTLPAETNKAAAKMYNIMLERTIRQDAAAREFVARNPTATPTEIINSPAYRAVDDWASGQLESSFGEKAKVSPQDMAREELKRRRGQQGGAQ